jgi:chemotaxis protein methyltransferase CheR
MVEGEYRLTSADFERISRILHEDSGIHLTNGKAALVYSRLAKRLRVLGLSSFRDYCMLLDGADGAEERRSMLAALTTNITRFFREPHHFDHLRKILSEKLASKAASGMRIRLWSAGCSTGEEPYSIAMTVLEALPRACDLDVRILATDIDPNVVATAQEGRYPPEVLEQIPGTMRGRFTRSGDRISVDKDLARLVAFGELNLMDDWPMKGKFDAIFCRNVAIYFNATTQARLWSRFADKLHDGGTLYVGHSERVDDPRYQSDGLTTYRLGGRAA